MKTFHILSMFLLFFGIVDENVVFARSTIGGEISSISERLWPPIGEKINIPITRDTGISYAEKEITGSNGGAKRLKLKGLLEYILLDVELSPLKGQIVTGALLHIRSASPQNAPITRLGVSSIASRWVEGNSKHYLPQKGSSCFSQAEFEVRNWAYAGSTLMDVSFGRGNTLWKFAECSSPDEKGWQACAVDIDVIAARIADLSKGFCLSDELGHEWSLIKEQFKFRYFPNRMCYSKESEESAPWLEVWVKGYDLYPPESVGSFNIDTRTLPAGQGLVSWRTPRDNGGGKTLGFFVSYKRKGEVIKSMPQYLIPLAGKPGEEVRMLIQDIPFRSGEIISLSVRAVDSSGNVGPSHIQEIRLSSNPSLISIPEVRIKPFDPSESLPKVGGIKVAVIDLVDKVDPRTGVMIPPRPSGYTGGNHIYSAPDKLIRIQAARNETVHFQLNLEGKAQDININYLFKQNLNLDTKILQFAYVNLQDQQGRFYSVLPDPLVPLEGHLSVPAKVGQVVLPHQHNHSLICELYIPHNEPPGKKRGELKISVGSEELVIDVDLTVWDFTLPNKLSFVPEMNSYWAVSPYDGYEYYRLAHKHRTCLNRLPYGWDGRPEFAPKWNGDEFIWDDWDRYVGPLLDGSAFNDMPRENEPVDVFYLPFNENWPADIYSHFNPSYWADEAFTTEYKNVLKKSYAAFLKHCEEKKWFDTIFQFYLNNKIYYRKEFPQNSAPWIFDEPVNTQDFWALRWYGKLWHDITKLFDGNIQMWYRCDISYFDFSRNTLWGIMDIVYLGDNNPHKIRMNRDERILQGGPNYAEYGVANRIETSNAQPILWSISAWSKGAMGVLPWQSIGSENSWKNAEQTALIYPDKDGPKPSIRLKAFTRGQEDVEYFQLFCDVFAEPRSAFSGWLGKKINLEGQFYRSLQDHSTIFLSEKIDTVALWKIRYRIGSLLSGIAPKYRRAILNRKRPEWNFDELPDIGYVSVAPEIESYKPDCNNFGYN